ncbi:MAG: hypothetical protein RJA44_2405 [Pseudomonadota bacterium]
MIVLRKLWPWVLAILIGVVLCIVLVQTLHHSRVVSNRHREREPLRVGYAIEPPYVQIEPGGRISGEEPEVLRAVLEAAGEAEPVWIFHDFSELIPALRAGRIDIIATGLFITPEREQLVDFTQPTMRVGTGLLVARGNPSRLRRMADLLSKPGLALAVISGAVEGQQARALGIGVQQILELPDANSCIAAVRAGRAAAFALSLPSLQLALRQNPTAAVELALSDSQDSAAFGRPAFAVRQGDPLRQRLDHVLAGWLGSPAHLDILLRHGFITAAEAAASGAAR